MPAAAAAIARGPAAAASSSSASGLDRLAASDGSSQRPFHVRLAGASNVAHEDIANGDGAAVRAGDRQRQRLGARRRAAKVSVNSPARSAVALALSRPGVAGDLLADGPRGPRRDAERLAALDHHVVAPHGVEMRGDLCRGGQRAGEQQRRPPQESFTPVGATRPPARSPKLNSLPAWPELPERGFVHVLGRGGDKRGLSGSSAAERHLGHIARRHRHRSRPASRRASKPRDPGAEIEPGPHGPRRRRSVRQGRHRGTARRYRQTAALRRRRPSRGWRP